MSNGPTIEFPVIVALKEGRRQFVTTWSLKTVLFCLSSFTANATHGAGLRVNQHLASKIAKEWATRGEIPPVPPLVVAIRSGSDFNRAPCAPDTGLGTLTMPIGAILDVCDGIHRVAALAKSRLPSATLLQNTWTILIIEVSDSHDLAALSAGCEKHRNPQGSKSCKSHSSSADHWPWTRQVVAGSRFLKHAVALDQSSLAPRSSKLWTGSAIRLTLNSLVEAYSINPTNASAVALSECWDSLTDSVPILSAWLAGTITTREIRANTILASASIIHALTEICLRSINLTSSLQLGIFANLASIDWSRKTGAWPETMPRDLQKKAWAEKLLTHCGFSE